MKKKTALILLFLWPIAASFISFKINANFFISTLLFLGVPSVFLSFIDKKNVKKVAIFSVLFAIPICLVVDYIMEATGAWLVTYSIFGSFRLFNFIEVDLVLWSILEAYMILMFYETFLDRHFTTKLYYPNLKYLVTVFCLALSVFVLIYVINPAILRISYFYLKAGIVIIAFPVVGTLLKFPKFLNKFLRMATYFFIFNFIYEVTAVRLGQWSFPAVNQLIGTVQIAGARFALEELLFWMILTAMAVVAFYEVFDDDRR